MTDNSSVLHGPPPEEPPPDLSQLNGYLPRGNLGQVVEAGYKPPPVSGSLIYHGRVHTLAGPPEAGKTVLALWLAYRYMQRGDRVLILDEETGIGQTGDLLRSMGADRALLDERCYYSAFNDLPWKGDDIEHLGMLLTAWKPKLTIMDSAGEMLSAAGINENDPAEVTRFYKIVLRPIAAKYRSAVLLLDHDAKAGDKQSRYARGSTAKLASPDVALKVHPVRPFNRMQDGVLSLTVSKDRLGSLHRWYRVRVTSSPLALELIKTTAMDTEGDSGMSPSAEKVYSVLTQEQMSVQAIGDKIAAKYGQGLRRETISRSLQVLHDQGLVEQFPMGAGLQTYWAKPGDALVPRPQDAAKVAAPDEEIPPPPDPRDRWR